MDDPAPLALVAITPALAQQPDVRGSDLLAQVCDATLAMYPAGEAPLPWAAYLAREGGPYVGTCAFKSAPRDGAVEIAYFTFPGQEGRGLATRMAQALVTIAAREGALLVRAQTLPQRNASGRILAKLGFTHVGDVTHPDDGLVWEWQRRLAG